MQHRDATSLRRLLEMAKYRLRRHAEVKRTISVELQAEFDGMFLKQIKADMETISQCELELRKLGVTID